jgi:hypothetical protein
MSCSHKTSFVFSFMTILLLTYCAKVQGKNMFIAQTARGADSGTDTANAHSAIWFNASGNWGGGTAKISAGDTVHLCGTLTSSVKINGSGANGNPITILFEPGSRFSSPHWNQGGTNSDAAISGEGLSYITLDGGKNGIIECTNNGTNKTYQVPCSGIDFSGCSNIIIKNLTVQNIYVRTAGTSGSFGNGIIFKPPSHDLTIQDNILNDAGGPLFIQYSAGDKNFFIFNNSSINAGEGNIVIGSSNNSSTVANVQIYNNTLSKGLGTWSGNPAIHTNCMHLFAVHTGSRIDSLKIFNNSVTGAWGTNSTSYIFLEGNIYSPKVYNNLFIAGDPGSGGGNGYLYIKESPGGTSIENNSFIGNKSGIGLIVQGLGANIKNNLFFNVSAPVICPYDTTGILSCDYNIYYKGTIFGFGNYSQITFSQWKARTQFDKKSLISQPILDTGYAPTSLDTTARGKGLNLAPAFISDKNGTLRPAVGPWTIGAFEISLLSAKKHLLIPQHIRSQQ